MNRVAQIIGHAKTDYVLDIYAKLEADELRKAICVLENGTEQSALKGATVQIPINLYNDLSAIAEEQHVSTDALITYLLTVANEDIAN